MARLEDPNVVEALQASGLLNADITLRQVVQVAQKIPGLNEGGVASWELITRDFAFKGIEGGGRLDERTLTGLQESGIINFDITLGEIVAIGARIPVGGSVGSWELVSRDFVLRGRAAHMVDVEV